jgi:menaquinone-dependent protoporphyrinogen oxidase
MRKNILVTYASKYGATKEIADKISQALLKSGMQAEVLPAGAVKDLTGYQAVVLGSAIYIGKWPKEAVKFLRENEKILAERPVWLFSSGPTGEGDPLALAGGQRLPNSLLPLVNRIHPRDIVVFHGFNNPSRLNFIEKWALKSIVKKPLGDFRDWNAIAKWADGITSSLKEE